MPERMERKIPKSCKTPKLKAEMWHAVMGYEHSLTLLSEKSGVSMATIFRFLQGTRDLRLETAGRLCEVLGLELKKAK